MDISINVIVVIISQGIPLSNHNLVHFKYIQFYLSIISQKYWKQQQNIARDWERGTTISGNKEQTVCLGKQAECEIDF